MNACSNELKIADFSRRDVKVIHIFHLERVRSNRGILGGYENNNRLAATLKKKLGNGVAAAGTVFLFLT